MSHLGQVILLHHTRLFPDQHSLFSVGASCCKVARHVSDRNLFRVIGFPWQRHGQCALPHTSSIPLLFRKTLYKHPLCSLQNNITHDGNDDTRFLTMEAPESVKRMFPSNTQGNSASGLWKTKSHVWGTLGVGEYPNWQDGHA